MVIGGAGLLLLVILGICIRKILREHEAKRDARQYVDNHDFKERTILFREVLLKYPHADPYKVFLWMFYRERTESLTWGEQQNMPESFEQAVSRPQPTTQEPSHA